MIVAIDGPAGTGKSTIARRTADRSGFFYLNSGRFYRAIAWKSLQRNVPASQSVRVVNIARRTRIEITDEAFLVDGEPRDKELHSAEVDAAVGAISSIREVREIVNRRIRAIAAERNIVVEGRDMSTVVFPDAEVKVYLDADPAVRAERRLGQLGTGDFDQIKRAIEERDRIDRAKDVGALRVAEDAFYIDTSHLTIEQVCEKVYGIIHAKNQHGRSS